MSGDIACSLLWWSHEVTQMYLHHRLYTRQISTEFTSKLKHWLMTWPLLSQAVNTYLASLLPSWAEATTQYRLSGCLCQSAWEVLCIPACTAQTRGGHTDHHSTLPRGYSNPAVGMVISWTALAQQPATISVFPLCQRSGHLAAIFSFLIFCFTFLAISSREMQLWAWFFRGSATQGSCPHTCIA